ncbi:head maturation protease, ClpP-related [Sebaldella termitidis]|uniref:head maturation protease, ClpP-related n=1 Tax=Sebaldella termitidis TaxID=826 RepID=UPI003EBB2442
MDRSKIFWNVVKNEEENSAEITLYGAIGSDECADDVVDKHVARTLESLKGVSNLKVYINSPGGSVPAATSIYNALKRHEAFVEVHIDGLAASAATIIACAGDKVYMPNNAIYMIHNPWTITAGDERELIKTADVMAKWKATIVDTYVKKTGLDEETLSRLMDDESWFSAEEALAYNFIDEISGEEIKVENYGNRVIVNNLSFDLGSFKNNPFKRSNNKNTIPISAKVTEKPVKEPKNIINKEENMTKAELKEKFPDMYNEIYQEGEQAERARIKNIEENAPSGFDDLVAKAKFDEPVNYEILAVNILREQRVRDEILKTENANKLAKIQGENGAGLAHVANNGSGSTNPTTNETILGTSVGLVINAMKKTKEGK